MNKQTLFIISCISLCSTMAFAADPSGDLVNARRLYTALKAKVAEQPVNQSSLDDKQQVMYQKQRERLAKLEDNVRQRERSEQIPNSESMFKRAEEPKSSGPRSAGSSAQASASSSGAGSGQRQKNQRQGGAKGWDYADQHDHAQGSNAGHADDGFHDVGGRGSQYEQPQKPKWAPKEYAEGRWVLLKGSGKSSSRMFKIIKQQPDGRIRLSDTNIFSPDHEILDVFPEDTELSVQEANGVKVGDWVYNKSAKRVQVLSVFPDGSVRTDGKGALGWLSGRDYFNTWKLNSGEYEHSPGIFERVGKIFSGKTGGALSVAPIASGAVRDAVEQQIDSAMNSGACPSVSASSKSSYDLAFTKDLPVLEASAETCRKDGKPYDFSAHIGELKTAKPAALSQVSCNDQGDLSIVFTNGYSSLVKFDAANRIASISTKKSDDSKAPSVEYANGGASWRVQTSVLDHGKKVTREEAFSSYFNRSYCMTIACSPSEIQTLISPIDDSTSKDNPYGNLGENDFSGVNASFFATKRAVLASFLKSGSYIETCKALGARTLPTSNLAFAGGSESGPAAKSGNRAEAVPGPKVLVK